jgi:hypothetical protein
MPDLEIQGTGEWWGQSDFGKAKRAVAPSIHYYYHLGNLAWLNFGQKRIRLRNALIIQAILLHINGVKLASCSIETRNPLPTSRAKLPCIAESPVEVNKAFVFFESTYKNDLSTSSTA